MKRMWLAALTLLGLFPSLVPAQVVIITNSAVILPAPPRPTPGIPFIRPTPPALYQISKLDYHATIREQVAQVQISQVFQNLSSQVLEAQIVFPLPDDAAISELTLLVEVKEFGGKIMRKEEARSIYEAIVRSRKDPALLEYMGQGLYQTSVFPVPPQASRTVQIRYSQLLKKDSGLVDLTLPLGMSKHANRPVTQLNVDVRVETNDPLRTIYSPTHGIELQRSDDKHAVCKLVLHNADRMDDFRLLFGTASGQLGTHLISYKPSDKEDGYFVLLVSPELKRAAETPLPRSMIFVLDRSGSMNGEKIKQAREALKFLIQQLRPQDTFNIVAYDSVVGSFRPELQRADAETINAALGYAEGLYAGGSTNIDGALQTSLKMLTTKAVPSYVLFLTDGLPTVGERNEQRIAANAKSVNQFGSRLFSFGVGYDVNSRLLDRLSRDNRGQSVYVRPNEDIEASVSTLYSKIGNPMLTDLSLNFEFDEPVDPSAAARINRLYPKQLTDLFHGEQLVLVGRYRKGGLAKVVVSGQRGGKPERFAFPVTFSDRSMLETNGFAEKLWATRRVGEIIDELDLRGHNQELVDELVQISIRHGIITPYTSFLADDNVQLADRRDNVNRAGENARRYLSAESGKSGVEQRVSKGAYQKADNLSAAAPTAPAATAAGALAGPAGNKPNSSPADAKKESFKGIRVLDESGDVKSIDSVRQYGQKTFFRKKDIWQDSTVTTEQQQKAIRVKQFSREYFDLAASHSGTLAKYLVFEEPVVVNLGDQTYQIDPAD